MRFPGRIVDVKPKVRRCRSVCDVATYRDGFHSVQSQAHTAREQVSRRFLAHRPSWQSGAVCGPGPGSSVVPVADLVSRGRIELYLPGKPTASVLLEKRTVGYWEHSIASASTRALSRSFRRNKIEELRDPGASAYVPRRVSCDAEALCGSRLDAVRLIAPSRRERPIVRAAPRRRA